MSDSAIYVSSESSFYDDSIASGSYQSGVNGSVASGANISKKDIRKSNTAEAKQKSSTKHEPVDGLTDAGAMPGRSVQSFTSDNGSVASLVSYESSDTKVESWTTMYRSKYSNAAHPSAAATNAAAASATAAGTATAQAAVDALRKVESVESDFLDSNVTSETSIFKVTSEDIHLDDAVTTQVLELVDSVFLKNKDTEKNWGDPKTIEANARIIYSYLDGEKMLKKRRR